MLFLFNPGLMALLPQNKDNILWVISCFNNYAFQSALMTSTLMKCHKHLISGSLSRGRLETNAEQWLRLLHTIQDLLAWILKKQHDLKSQRPVGGDNTSLQRQMETNKVCISDLP
jgi:hypothetical protein